MAAVSFLQRSRISSSSFVSEKSATDRSEPRASLPSKIF
ncbi:hypothetical protein CK1_34690 [Ruminococcus sp. SR1/5]|nr:hypothetical protein CK1_34690 [Ruminococcus sp. SR1/5]